MKKISKLLISLSVCLFSGAVGSVFTTPAIGNWYYFLDKPSFSPPNWIFAPAWTTLYILMGISLYLVWSKNWEINVSQKDEEAKVWNKISKKLLVGSWREENVIAIFALQLILNILWSVVFFGLKSPGLAFFEILMLWFAILYMIVNFYRVSKTAALLQIPYIVWVSFAAFLNYSVWMLN